MITSLYDSYERFPIEPLRSASSVLSASNEAPVPHRFPSTLIYPMEFQRRSLYQPGPPCFQPWPWTHRPPAFSCMAHTTERAGQSRRALFFTFFGSSLAAAGVSAQWRLAARRTFSDDKPALNQIQTRVASIPVAMEPGTPTACLPISTAATMRCRIESRWPNPPDRAQHPRRNGARISAPAGIGFRRRPPRHPSPETKEYWNSTRWQARQSLPR